MFCEKGVLSNFAKFTGKHLCQSLFLIKLQAAPATFLWILRNFKNTFFYRTPLVAASDKCLEEFDLTFTFSKIVLLKETIKLLQHMQLISLENKGLNFNHDIFPRFIYFFFDIYIVRLVDLKQTLKLFFKNVVW